MKTQEEIEQLAKEEIERYRQSSSSIDNPREIQRFNGFIKGYQKCQEDMALQGKCLSGKTYDNCHIHSSNIFGCLSCGNFERNKQD